MHEVPYFSNTFQTGYLITRSAFAGAILGFLTSTFFHSPGNDSIEKFQTSALFIFLFLMIAPAGMNWLNHHFASETRYERVRFLKESGVQTSRFGVLKGENLKNDLYYTEFLRNDLVERIRSTHPLFTGIKHGALIDIPVKKGLLGFDFVEIR